MSRSTRTCQNCRSMISDPDLFAQACSIEGLKVTQTVEEFLLALEIGCYICQLVRDECESWREWRPNDPFYLLEENVPLVKNVKCRKSGDKEDPILGYELPQDHHFDTLLIEPTALSGDQIMFDVEALDDNPAAKWVSARPLDPNVNRPEAVQSIKQWLSDCVDHHHQCVLRNPTAGALTTSPKRLIRVDMDLDGRLRVRLVLNSDQETRPYVALSYCWGVAQNVILTEANIEAWYTEFSVSSLPRSIQDALLVVITLGLDYLWVDALCIIQDCSTDKDEEISVMNRIYEQAKLTICVGSAAACTEGFLQARSFGERPMPTLEYSALQLGCPSGEQGTVLVKYFALYQVDRDPLYKRAWTLQEQMLSSRVLVYSSCQVWWECLEVKGCDRGKPYNIRSDGDFVGKLPRNGLMKRVERSLNHDHDYLWKAWKEIIEDYSRRKLTIATDKLRALSGLASNFSDLWGCTYYAGLWERRLLEGLRWISPEPPSWKPEEYTAPSWSWASTVGTIIWNDEMHNDTLAENSLVEHTKVMDCRVTLSNDNIPFGQVTDGSLMIEGYVQWIEWDGQPQIEAKDLSPDFCVTKGTDMGDPLYPEGIVANAEPDYDQIELSSTTWEPYLDPVTPDCSTITFWMGRVVQAEENEAMMRILLLVIDRTSALMLYALDNDLYERIGLLEFRYEKDLNDYFRDSNVKRVVIK